MKFSNQRGADAADAYDEELAAWRNSEAGKAAIKAETEAAILRRKKAGEGFGAWCADAAALLERYPEPDAKASEEATAIFSRGECMWLDGAEEAKRSEIMAALGAYLDKCRFLERLAAPKSTYTLAEKRAGLAVTKGRRQLASDFANGRITLQEYKNAMARMAK